ncbi:MAG: response regulator [Phaeodactylibacter sp.]|nr:response regulator [Phaeodactylibacter sp.]
MKDTFQTLFKTPKTWRFELQVLALLAIGAALLVAMQVNFLKALERKDEGRMAVERFLALSDAIEEVEDSMVEVNLALETIADGSPGLSPDAIGEKLQHLEASALRLSDQMPGGLPVIDSITALVNQRIEEAYVELARLQAGPGQYSIDASQDRWSAALNELRSSLLGQEEAAIRRYLELGRQAGRRQRLFNIISPLLGLAVLAMVTFIILRGIRRARQAEAQLIHAREDAEAAALAKEQFLANMSHEIRTPLNAILGFSAMLQRSSLEARQQEFAAGIHTASQTLLAIVNDILDLSKLEAGMVRIESIPFSLGSLLHSLDNMFQKQARDKGIAFRAHPLQGVPGILVGDPTRLTQMLANLLGNAIKFTAKGHVGLWVKNLREEEDGQVLLSFKIQDTGIGIPADKLPGIFERFEQGASDMARRYGGAGLGLSIVRKLAELQQGKVYARSREGQGSTFYLEIPYRVATSEEHPSQELEVEELESLRQNIAGLKVLLVEDNPMNQRIIELMLERWGIRPVVAENGEVALGELQKQTFGLVLMDIQMPVLDGYSTARQIRDTLKLDVPIIAMTAHAMPGEREKCLSYGMNDYLSKPAREKELYHAILRNTRQLPELSGAAATDTGKGPLSIDYDYLMEVSGDSIAGIRELAQIFLGQLPEELDQLQKASQASNFTELATAAHRMKGTVGYMGLGQSLGQQLKSLELAARNEDQTSVAVLMLTVSQMATEALRLVREEVLSLD